MIKDENCFDKYMKTWKKVSHIIKKKNFSKELIHNKKYLKAKKNNTKESFPMFLNTSNIDYFSL